MTEKAKKQKEVDELLEEALVPKEEEPYEIPDNWSWTKLGLILEKIQYGYTEKATFEKVGPHFLRITDLNEDGVNWNGVPYCKISDKDKDKFLLNNNDIVVARMGSVGKSFLLKEPEDSVFASYLIRLVLKEKIYPDYIAHFMKSNFYWAQINTQSKGTTRPNANANVFKKMNIPLPPRKEQERIAHKVERLLNKIDEAKQLIVEAKKTFKLRRVAVLDKAIRGELTGDWREKNKEIESAFNFLRTEDEVRRSALQPKEKPNYLNYQFERHVAQKTDLPKTWVQTTVGFLCDCIVPGRDKPRSFTGDIPWVTIPDIQGNYLYKDYASYFLSEEEIEKVKAKVIPKNSVVMSCVGRFGISSVVKTPLVINQQLHAFLPSRMIIPEYLMYHIRILVPYMNSLATSTTISYLNKTNANSLPINLPPIKEQLEIVKILDNYFEKELIVSETINQQLENLETLKASILSQAFRGELDTNDTTEESATELLIDILKE